MPVSDHKCAICHSEELADISGFSEFYRVTSDCKPFTSGGHLAICKHCGQIQKRLTDCFQSEITQIYEDYESYYQSGGEEQKCWHQASKQFLPRSQIIANTLKELQLVKNQGEFLDVGCGVGVTLGQFHAYFPQWTLSGAEYDSKNEQTLRDISGFDTLYTGELSNISKKFDCISFIHAIEHMSEPVNALKDAWKLCSEEGVLVIQVLDFYQHKYDLLIADHLFHFSKATLARLVELAGFEVCFLSNDLIKKEITLIAKKSSQAKPTSVAINAEFSQEWQHLTETIAFLKANKNMLEREVSEHGKLTVFGTSIASVWVSSQFQQYIEQYLDEDPARVGSEFFGKPILHPSGANFERVFFPFAREIGQSIAKRHQKTIAVPLFPDIS